jgi:hypothetical protein
MPRHSGRPFPRIGKAQRRPLVSPGIQFQKKEQNRQSAFLRVPSLLLLPVAAFRPKRDPQFDPNDARPVLMTWHLARQKRRRQNRRRHNWRSRFRGPNPGLIHVQKTVTLKPCSRELARDIPARTLPLLADVQPANDIEVLLRVDSAQVIQQTTTAADHAEQATPTGVVLRMSPHVLRQRIDPTCQECDLHFRRTAVGIAPSVLKDYFCFPVFRDCHTLLPLSRAAERLALIASDRPISLRLRGRNYSLSNFSTLD